MPLSQRFIGAAEADGPVFSVCSLVQDAGRYQGLLDSFERNGFTAENSEFLAADNRDQNQFDGYSWLKHLLAEARGRFVIFTHDDIELVDEGFDQLLGWTRWLDETDPAWLVAGVAGGVWHHPSRPRPALALRISDKFGANRRRGTLPARVESLDECFIMMRRTRPVISSYDLTGFLLRPRPLPAGRASGRQCLCHRLPYPPYWPGPDRQAVSRVQTGFRAEVPAVFSHASAENGERCGRSWPDG
jgi:hypothetical protein